MSIKVEFSNGVFKPLEKVDNVSPGTVYTVLSEDELRSLAEDLQWLKASEKSFEFWDNPEANLRNNRIKIGTDIEDHPRILFLSLSGPPDDPDLHLHQVCRPTVQR